MPGRCDLTPGVRFEHHRQGRRCSQGAIWFSSYLPGPLNASTSRNLTDFSATLAIVLQGVNLAGGGRSFWYALTPKSGVGMWALMEVTECRGRRVAPHSSQLGSSRNRHERIYANHDAATHHDSCDALVSIRCLISVALPIAQNFYP